MFAFRSMTQLLDQVESAMTSLLLGQVHSESTKHRTWSRTEPQLSEVMKIDQISGGQGEKLLVEYATDKGYESRHIEGAQARYTSLLTLAKRIKSMCPETSATSTLSFTYPPVDPATGLYQSVTYPGVTYNVTDVYKDLYPAMSRRGDDEK